jgi:hypothetical protein
MTARLGPRRVHDWHGSDNLGSDGAAAFVRRHPWVVTLGRVGWVAKGVVYALTGVLALTLATDNIGATPDSDEANQTGAVSKVAQQPFGTTLLWLLAIGLFIYAAWRIVTVVLPADTDTEAWLNRIGYTVSAIVYIALGLTAISLARQPGTASSEASRQEDAKIEQFTADVLGWSGGRLLIGLLGLVVIAIGFVFAWKGISASFTKHLEQRRVGPFDWHVIKAMGRIGWVGRGVMMALIGWFLLRAAVQFDAAEARGLDDSLRRVADSSVGVVLVLVVAVGLAVYGAFCIITAPSVKLVASDDRTTAR